MQFFISEIAHKIIGNIFTNIRIAAVDEKYKKEGEIFMAIGIVKNFNKDKGFGFINMEGEERDIFFHYSQLVQEGFKTIDPGQKVEFELVEGDRGLQAHQVVKITE